VEVLNPSMELTPCIPQKMIKVVDKKYFEGASKHLKIEK